MRRCNILHDVAISRFWQNLDETGGMRRRKKHVRTMHSDYNMGTRISLAPRPFNLFVNLIAFHTVSEWTNCAEANYFTRSIRNLSHDDLEHPHNAAALGSQKNRPNIWQKFQLFAYKVRKPLRSGTIPETVLSQNESDGRLAIGIICQTKRCHTGKARDIYIGK